jgi:RNA polymerase sigma-70 factor (ECF subfamily)
MTLPSLSMRTVIRAIPQKGGTMNGGPSARKTLDPREALPPVTDGYSHAEFVRQLNNGNTQAFEWVVERFREPLQAFARRLQPGQVEPEDIAQEAIAQIWLRRESLRPDGSVRAFLFTTVRNLSLNARRMVAIRATHRSDLPRPQAFRSPLEDVLGSELRKITDDAIRGLPPRRRQVFTAVKLDGLSHREASEALGISPQTIANTLNAAMMELRSSLEDHISP